MSAAQRILVLSPDTDVYHIGLTQTQKDVIVQINPYSSKQLTSLHLCNLKNALACDPDLATLQKDLIPQIFQTLYVATGCDYISFFHGIGKATFFRYFYQYADFITSGQGGAPGTLADTALHNAQMDVGYLSFLRLVGTVYYKKYNTGFETPNPVTHFNSFHQPDTTPVLHHHQWMENIRQTIWDRVQFETEIIPSNDALDRHWKRTCWVLDMWKQSSQSTMLLKPLTDYGWRIEGEKLMYEWDSEENMAVVRQRVDTLLKGCHCKTGCKTARCSCRKKEAQCAAGCECVNCHNRCSVHPTEDDSLLAVSFEEEILEQSHDQQLLREVEETMQMVFGDGDMPYTSSSEDDDNDNA